MERKQIAIRWILLISSFLFLLSVIVPHHHHDDGRICLVSFFSNELEHGDCDSCGGNCDCDSHNHPLHSCNGCSVSISEPSYQSHLTHTDVTPILVQLFIFADYLYPNDMPLNDALCGRCVTSFAETLHDVWIADASGLRAPPLLMN